MVSRWGSQLESTKLILELDLGNTRAKWRIVKNQTDVIAQGVANINEWLNGQFPEAWRSGVDRARIASVLASTTENELLAKMQSELCVPSQLARSVASCSGIIGAYADPERLGVDRWLALMAAYKLGNDAVMVVDVGTALKVDVVDDAGRHRGGYIIPGPTLMENALLQGTDRVRYEDVQSFESVALGLDTRSCVQHGIAAALVGAVLVAIEQCRSIIGKQPRFCLTGGSGAMLEQYLHNAGISDIRFEADLVLDGLRWALP